MTNDKKDSLKKLIRIKYSGKIFDVFVDSYNKKHFYEVEKIDNKEKYHDPSLTDSISLKLIFTGLTSTNCKYDKEQLIKNLHIRQKNIEKLTAYTLVLTCYAISAGVVLGGACGIGYLTLNHLDPSFVSVQEQNLIEKADFNDVLNTLDSNSNLTDSEKDRIREYILCLNRKLPEIDYTILNDNLKNLKIKIGSVIDSAYENVAARYIPILNELIFENEDFYNDDSIFYHEMTHVLTSSVVLNLKGVYRVDFSDKDSYGRGIDEGKTEVVAYYLTNDTYNSFDEYLMSDYEKTVGYTEEITKTTYDLMRLTKDDFTVYDYLFSDVNELETELKKYDLDGIIDCVDAELSTILKDVTMVDNSEFNYYLNTLDSLLKVKQNEEYMDSSNNVTDFNSLESNPTVVAYYNEEESKSK